MKGCRRGCRTKNYEELRICRGRAVSIAQNSTYVRATSDGNVLLALCIIVIKIANQTLVGRSAGRSDRFIRFADELWKMTVFRRIALIRALAHRDNCKIFRFNRPRACYFHGRIQFYVVLFPFIPLLLALGIKIV